MLEQMFSNVSRPQGIYDNVERKDKFLFRYDILLTILQGAMSISVLDAATDDLASLIN